MNPKDKKFKALKDQWYKKLEASGFEDAERDEWSLKRPSRSVGFRNKHDFIASGRWESVRDYYYMAEQFLNSYKFKNKREKKIWEYHSQGHSCQTIANMLRKDKIADLTYQPIWVKITELTKIMKQQNLLQDWDSDDEQ